MKLIGRRTFLRSAGVSSLGILAASSKTAEAAERAVDDENTMGCLVDTTRCIGCRKCEEACNAINGLPEPETPFDQKSVFNEQRRPDASAYTVVNRFDGSPSPDQPYCEHTYVKLQCMHCLDPACVSACIVGALKRQENGAITYDAGKCIGCRYCMVACPFQIPAYEYHKAATPRVSKCTYCFDKLTSHGEQPACASACPREAILFGKRRELLKVAHEGIRHRPDRYVDHVYGEHEAGGTAWLYLAGRDLAELDLLDLPGRSVVTLSETIQHGVFKQFIPPVLLYTALAGTACITHRRDAAACPVIGSETGRNAKPEESEDDG